MGERFFDEATVARAILKAGELPCTCWSPRHVSIVDGLKYLKCAVCGTMLVCDADSPTPQEPARRCQACLGIAGQHTCKPAPEGGR
jgi:hypothetical protein